MHAVHAAPQNRRNEQYDYTYADADIHQELEQLCVCRQSTSRIYDLTTMGTDRCHFAEACRDSF